MKGQDYKKWVPDSYEALLRLHNLGLDIPEDLQKTFLDWIAVRAKQEEQISSRIKAFGTKSSSSLSYTLTPDEQMLIALCNGNSDLIRKAEELINALHRTWVFPFWVSRCHAWANEFERLYSELDAEDRFSDMTHEYPLCVIWWAPGWQDHSVMTFTINGTKVYLDKGLQGGEDHISFEPRADLIYRGDPRYFPELDRRRELERRPYKDMGPLRHH